MLFTQTDVLEFVRENDVKFIRLAFCNLYGVLKNIAIMPDSLADAFENGYCVDAASVDGFLTDDDADLFLHPDPTTLCILPWRPSHGRVVRLFCDIRRRDGSPCPGDGRQLLQAAVKKAAERGYTCQIGCECEFYLFQLDENGLPTDIPHDQAGYCDVAPLDKGENMRREVCLALEDMGFPVESSHHERGPGQNEIVLRWCGALEAADALVTMRSVTQVIAARNGLYACFLPKPIRGRDGSSVHVNLSLAKNGANLFRTPGGGEHCPEAESFMAGILKSLPELTLFLNPLESSYKRFGDDIPACYDWSDVNRNQTVRVPFASGAHARMELRSPDPCLSPYFAFALLLEAGLAGIEERLELKKYTADEAPAAPADRAQAAKLAADSSLVKSVISDETLQAFLSCNPNVPEN